MLVYGDAVRSEEPHAMLARILDGAARVAAMPAGIERHGALAAVFIEAGELAQGIADADFAAEGCDAPSPTQSGAMALLMRLAGALQHSWDSGFAAALEPIAAPELEGLTLPDKLEIKRPEGYAFYALYPEGYLEAAKALAGGPPPTVIGIRSIGTGLAALVASVLGAEPPITVRPVAHPFRRELALSPAFADGIRSRSGGTYAVVDEGPGLSGSSFGAVVDFLEGAGVPLERIHIFPSHLGELGPEASAAHRERWARLPRHCVPFDAFAVPETATPQSLRHWVEDLVGPLTAPLADLSGGAWRGHAFASEAEWPAANVQQERLKFLAQTDSGTFLVKFAGLSDAAHKLAAAARLSEAGFTPPVVGVRHGFLVERWIADAKPLDLGRTDRGRLVETLGRYLAFRARQFPAGAGRGAPLAKLAEMARHNAAQLLGPVAGETVAVLLHGVERLEAEVRPIEIDGRLHAWEWLARPAGRLLKADALDHHAAHDLVGCQDVTWDVAGATVELALTDAEQATLCEIIARETGRPVSADLLGPLKLCYLAFHGGAQALAAQALVGFPQEAERLKRSRDAYAAALKRALSPHP